MINWLNDFISEHLRVVKSLDNDKILELIDILKKTRDSNRCIFIAGNGGDAACVSHLSCDLAKGASYNREKRFRVITLVDNIPWITAIANDLSYDEIFSEQLLNLAVKGDLLIVLSVSGSSENIVKVVATAKELGLYTVGILGDRNGKVIDMVDLPIVVPSGHFGHVEDIQAFICHIISYYFMENENV